MYSCHRYSEGHVFFEQGASGTSAHIIRSGRVEITIQQGNREIVIDVFGPGDIFGEMALLGTRTRTATARALEKTEVINISRARLLRLLRNGDPLIRHIVLSFVNRLKNTNSKVRPQNADNICMSLCRILDLMMTPLTEEDGSTVLPYDTVIERVRAILSIDATDCRVILERLQAINIIEILQKSSTNQSIRIANPGQFLQKAERASTELEDVLSNRLTQRPVYLDLFDFSEAIEVQRERIHKKIGEGAFPGELLLFKKEDILKWAEEVGPSFFEEKRTRISSAEELKTLDDVVYVRNAILREVLNSMDFYKICQLLKDASEGVRAKILSNLSGRLKQVVEQELDLIEEVDPDEVEEATEDLLDEIRDVMEANKKEKGREKKHKETEDADDEQRSGEEEPIE